MAGPSYYLIEAAAIITAGGATATAGLAWRSYQHLQQIDRTLYGLDETGEWNGLVEEVETNIKRLEEEGIR